MTRRWFAAGGAAVVAATAIVVWVGRGDSGSGRPARPARPAASAAATAPAAAPAAVGQPMVPGPGLLSPASTPPTSDAPAPAATVPPPVASTATQPRAVAQPACARSGDLAVAPFPDDDPRAGRRWVTVGHLAGRCEGASPVFHLRGIDTRLLFRSGGGSLVVFLVDARQGLDATAGYADAECEGPCSDSQVLVDQAGDYLLQVRSSEGPWEVAVQEYRAP